MVVVRPNASTSSVRWGVGGPLFLTVAAALSACGREGLQEATLVVLGGAHLEIVFRCRYVEHASDG
jgi:hypothetical protein